MDELTLENFRCFRERQTARLAPLTLLVGENSTGKTSMMAMVRVLWQVLVHGTLRPDFKQEPYDLGSFREIAHRASGKDGPTEFFTAGFGIGNWKSEATFEQGKISTQVRKLRLQQERASIEWNVLEDGTVGLEAETQRGRWAHDGTAKKGKLPDIAGKPIFEDWSPFSFLDLTEDDLEIMSGSSPISERDFSALSGLLHLMLVALVGREQKYTDFGLPTAVAPVRSRPHRTYDPGPGFHDPEGEGLPALLAALAHSDEEQWNGIREKMEVFGRRTGVFDELRIRHLGCEAGSDPFQLQVRKQTGSEDGSWRNLVDAGYGVSQILPLFLEFTHPEATAMLQLQQPEVHLHPSAQAGLGSILCEVAASGRQLLVETHSDHLINRVRMDVRDGTTDLKPEDVSLLFFERSKEEGFIHSLRFDRQGNVLDAPPGYRRFFKDEVNRSLGL